MPDRVQLRRTKGWRMPPNTVKVDRTTRWGNPYQGQGTGADRAHLVRLFRDYLTWPEQADKVAAAKRELRGKNLACWCPPGEPCHADVWLEVANGRPSSPSSRRAARTAAASPKRGIRDGARMAEHDPARILQPLIAIGAKPAPIPHGFAEPVAGHVQGEWKGLFYIAPAGQDGYVHLSLSRSNGARVTQKDAARFFAKWGVTPHGEREDLPRAAHWTVRHGRAQ
jgi:hypothetical protein